MTELQTSLPVGGTQLRNRVFLAPMSGVTDAPFRRLAWRFGAGIVVSEMVASEALVTGNAEMQLKAASAGLPQHIVQIAGREAKWMALAARMAAESGADVIDINMGCPARRVTSGLSGSALMRDPDHALGLIEAVVGAVDMPVTLKMRLGWDENHVNAPEIARRSEDAGIRMLTVHGRTRCQFYKGHADWSAVRAVRNATRLPLAVNGDIAGPRDVERALALSGADAVMVGRASYGAPWLAGALARGTLSPPADIGAVVLAHYDDMLSHYGRQAGLRQARKHLGWYLEKHAPGAPSALKREMMTSSEPRVVFGAIAAAFEDAAPHPVRRAA
ncbi:MAG: tRNA dihydrouridine synthase DusB [Pseudomonadota bacterium]|nr:tRNA dihydrouridine synthase DusB [Pseudomonadota bacterium]